MSAAKPLLMGDRYARYVRQNGAFRLTPRQTRRIIHKGNRALRRAIVAVKRVAR